MAKDTCETSYRLPISFLKQKGYLQTDYSGTITWSRGEAPVSEISLTSHPSQGYIEPYYWLQRYGEEEKTHFRYQVRLTTTPCYFGGRRYWFVCPLFKNNIPCQRRVGVLYRVGKYFGCRKCHDLAYETQQETHTGFYGLLKGYIGMSSKIQEGLAELRVKHWKGRPTRRYKKLLKKLDRFDDNQKQFAEVEKRLRQQLAR